MRGKQIHVYLEYKFSFLFVLTSLKFTFPSLLVKAQFEAWKNSEVQITIEKSRKLLVERGVRLERVRETLRKKVGKMGRVALIAYQIIPSQGSLKICVVTLRHSFSNSRLRNTFGVVTPWKILLHLPLQRNFSFCIAAIFLFLSHIYSSILSANLFRACQPLLRTQTNEFSWPTTITDCAQILKFGSRSLWTQFGGTFERNVNVVVFVQLHKENKLTSW